MGLFSLLFKCITKSVEAAYKANTMSAKMNHPETAVQRKNVSSITPAPPEHKASAVPVPTNQLEAAEQRASAVSVPANHPEAAKLQEDDGYIKPDEIYRPEKPRQRHAVVQHIGLTYEKARMQGWHFRRKSRNRIRITRYTGTMRNIIVPTVIDDAIVNELGELAFQNTEIDSIEIPDTVKKLQKRCFMQSTVQNVTFAEGITRIPEEAFASCTQLRSIHLPTTLQHIGTKAFYSCKGLPYINIPYHCYDIGAAAFSGSGLEGFALAFNHTLDGSALANTPLHRTYKIILAPNSRMSDVDYHILLVGFGVKIKFPQKGVYFGRHSVIGSCKLDLSECSRVTAHTEAFHGYYSVNVIMPPGERSMYIPNERVHAQYPDGRAYSYFTLTHESADEAVFSVGGNELPSDSLRYLWKWDSIKIESDHTLRFYESAVDFMRLTHISLPNIAGTGTLFGNRCIRLHHVEWNGNCAYIPSEELVRPQVHRHLLKAFSGRLEGGIYHFFDSRIIDQVFTEPVNSYAKLYTPAKKPVYPSHKCKTLLAIDVLRSTESCFPNRDMYVRYLKKHRRCAEAVCAKLPEQWHEYQDFLQSFYEETQ